MISDVNIYLCIKGVEGSQEHPSCSAFARVGNLWGEIEQTGLFIGPSVHRLTWGLLLTSFYPLPYCCVLASGTRHQIRNTLTCLTYRPYLVFAEARYSFYIAIN
jgi:hypothetical protein